MLICLYFCIFKQFRKCDRKGQGTYVFRYPQPRKMPYLYLILRAIEPELNLNRVYEIWLDKGLFNSWLVLTAYGRHAGGTTQKNHSFSTLEEAKAFIGQVLDKRLKAEKRIGCNYKLVSACGLSDEMPIF